MIVVVHVVIALLSIGQSSFTLVAPSRAKLRLSYGLVAATLTSGTYLVWSLHAPLLEPCVMGLCYLAGVSVALGLAQRKLAANQ